MREDKEPSFRLILPTPPSCRVRAFHLEQRLHRSAQDTLATDRPWTESSINAMSIEVFDTYFKEPGMDESLRCKKA
jgi:hypothetical protein